MRKVLLDYRVSESEKEILYKYGYESLIIPKSKSLYSAVCGHPDMLLHILDKNNIIVHKDMDISFIITLENIGYNVIKSQNSLQSKYPYDILLNGFSMNSFFFHNLKYTDPKLLSLLKSKKLFHINQGYSKCSTAIISANAAMTSDVMIHQVLSSCGIDVLLLPPKHIELPGLDYGFIGGSCGILDEGTIAFFGNLDKYKHGKEVMSFLIKHDVKPLYLRDKSLIDRGTLFCL
ncbi:DUF6873 family GME fold protein [Clostridium akagii]|uniref:DUF6873 family GME fold protein n=1 Tax=Clostridium akagii TaxID=91623 RepID=UPI00047D692D|nr:hypothetical protein [Clostridium akagii]